MPSSAWRLQRERSQLGWAIWVSPAGFCALRWRWWSYLPRKFVVRMRNQVRKLVGTQYMLAIDLWRIDHMPFIPSTELLKETLNRTGPMAGPLLAAISEPGINFLDSITEPASNRSSTEAGIWLIFACWHPVWLEQCPAGRRDSGKMC